MSCVFVHTMATVLRCWVVVFFLAFKIFNFRSTKTAPTHSPTHTHTENKNMANANHSFSEITDAAGAFKKIHPLDYYRSFLREGVRANDGRQPHEFRPLSISSGSLSKCDASSLVKLGQTSVLCGVKSEVAAGLGAGGGVVIAQIRVPSLCSERMASSGSFAAREKRQQELTVLVNDVLQRCLDTSTLTIDAEQEVAWVLYVDAYVLEDAGNLEDACLIAVQTALHDLKLPLVQFDEERQEVRMAAAADESKQGKERFQYDQPRLLTRFALASTFVQVEVDPDTHQFVILADPTQSEEDICDSKFTIVYDDQGNLLQARKSRGTHMSEVEMREMMQRAKMRTVALKRQIQQRT